MRRWGIDPQKDFATSLDAGLHGTDRDKPLVLEGPHQSQIHNCSLGLMERHDVIYIVASLLQIVNLVL